MKLVDEKKVKKFMIDLDLDSSDLKFILNKSPDSISKKLRNEINFTFDDALKMRKAFNCEIEDLLTDDAKKIGGYDKI